MVKDKFTIGAGGMFGTVLGTEKSGFGIVYGITTFGSRDANVSLGVGYGYLSGDWAKKPMINISSFIRVSPRTYIITENYVISGESTTVLISLGARTLVKRIGIDYGLFMPFFPDQDTYYAIPWFGITVPMHKAKVDNR